MLTSADVGKRNKEIEQENKDKWENLLREFSPEHPHSPFHRFFGRIISGPSKTQLRNIWRSLAHQLEATIEQEWRAFDGWRGLRLPNRQDQARQFIQARLDLAEPWFENLIAQHNAQVRNAWTSKAQAKSLPLATSGQGAPAAAGGAEGDTPPADPFADLRQFAGDELKGQEQTAIEALCDSGGELRIPDLAVKVKTKSQDPFQWFRNTQSRLNPKLKQRGWELVRQKNAAKLKFIPSLQVSAKKALLQLD